MLFIFIWRLGSLKTEIISVDFFSYSFTTRVRGFMLHVNVISFKSEFENHLGLCMHNICIATLPEWKFILSFSLNLYKGIKLPSLKCVTMLFTRRVLIVREAQTPNCSKLWLSKHQEFSSNWQKFQTKCTIFV